MGGGSGGRHTHTQTTPANLTIQPPRANIALNLEQLPDPFTQVRALAMDWGEPASYPSSPVDVVLGSDLVYQKSIGPLLSKVRPASLIALHPFNPTHP